MRIPAWLIVPAVGAIIAAIAVTGQHNRPAATAAPAPQQSAQASADCAWNNTNCPLGHAVQQQASNDGGVTETYTLSADKVALSPTDQLGDPVLPGEHYYNVKFTMRGVAGYGGVNDSAGDEAILTGSDGKTYYYNSDGTDPVSFDLTKGQRTTGWLLFGPMPDDVTIASIGWGISAGTSPDITWQP